MKILQINMEKGWRGGEAQTFLSMEQFRQAHHEVELLARADEPLATRAKHAGFKVHSYQEAHAIALFFLSGKARKYDIVHCQTANSLTWAALLKWCYKGKLVYSRRTAFPVKPHKENRTRKKWLKTDLFVGVTRSSMDEAIRLGVIDSVMDMATLKRLASSGSNKANQVIPSATVPQAFDSQRFNDILTTHQIKNKKIIAVVAAITTEKEPLTQIEAIHRLHQQRQDFVVLHFGSGDMLRLCQAKVKALGLEQVYYFMGFQKHVEQLFKGFDVYLLSSRYEGANNGIVNSFFNQVPVVSTASGGPNDLIGMHNQRGYLCPVGDTQAIADSLNQALNRDDITKNQLILAEEYAIANHTAEVMANRYLTAFQVLLDQS